MFINIVHLYQLPTEDEDCFKYNLKVDLVFHLSVIVQVSEKDVEKNTPVSSQCLENSQLEPESNVFQDSNSIENDRSLGSYSKNTIS